MPLTPNFVFICPKGVIVVFRSVEVAEKLTDASVRQHRPLTNDVALLAQQDEYSGEYGEYRHNDPQPLEKESRDKCYHTRDYEPEGQQQHPYVLREVHRIIPFLVLGLSNAKVSVKKMTNMKEIRDWSALNLLFVFRVNAHNLVSIKLANCLPEKETNRNHSQRYLYSQVLVREVRFDR